jgi:YD repeat-containing protein
MYLRLLAAALVVILLGAGSAGAETRYVRDAQGRVVLETRDDGTRISYTYTADGRVVRTVLSDGSVLEVAPPPAPPARPSGN